MEKHCCWYDEAAWYDLAFSWEPDCELDFLNRAFERWSDRDVKSLLEPGCGSGHYLIPLRKRYRVTGFDLNPAMVSLCNAKAKEAGLPEPRVYAGDFADFEIGQAVDSAYMLIDTIRHLTTGRALESHFRAMHRAVAPGGVYVLGFDLKRPGDRHTGPGCSWTIERGGRSVTATVASYRPPDERRRQDFTEARLQCRNGDERFTLVSRYRQRWLTWREFTRVAATGRLWSVAWATTLDYDTRVSIDPARHSGNVVLVLKRLDGRRTRPPALRGRKR